MNKKTFSRTGFAVIAFLLCFFVNAQTPSPTNTLYVNINVTGGNGSGDSWENAIPQLADALKYARLQYDADNTVYDAQPLKIFVAKGTYKPLYNARDNYYTETGSATVGYTDKDNAFVMVKNVQVYGGFDPENGIDDLTDTRIFGANGSVLSAEVGYDHISGDEAYHVVISSGAVGSALLNGFTLRDAYSNYLASGYIQVFGYYPIFRGSGGAISCIFSSPTIENCIITKNLTSQAGGIFNYQTASPTIINCTFIDNGTTGNGGAIYNSTNSSPTIINCNFTDNGGENGGAIYNATNSNPIITNCSFTDNSSRSNGGGAIYNIASSPIITNSLFANNSARNSISVGIWEEKNGGAIYNESTSSPVLTNVTIADNLGANTVYSTGTGSTTFYNSIVFGTVSATYTAQNSLIEGNSDFTNGNMDMTGITANDVFTDNANGDYTLKSTSPAIDMGSNALNSTTEDLAGNARIFNNAIIDLGAYESEYTPIVLTPDANGIIYVKETATGNTDGSSWNNATADLHNAIHTDGVQKVFVAVGNYNVGANSFVMKNNVEIYGGFDPANGLDDLSDTRILPNSNNNIEGTVLNGQNTRPLIWNFNNGVNSSAVLDGFTLKNGSSVNGGAIHNRSVSPTLRNLWIKNNTASADGGGIFNENSVSSVISNVTIENNTANFAGGIFNKNSSSPEMNNVVIRNNTANNDGGGMYNDVSSSPVMTNVSITENAAQNGAGIYNRTNAAPVLVNALIADNTAVTNGGAIRNEATSSPQLVNVTIVNNTGSNALYATDGNTTINNSVVFGTVSADYTAQYSLIEGNAGGTNGNLDGTTITANDVFTDNTNGDYTLKSASPVINAGSNALFAGLNENTKDLAGNARVYGFNNSGIIDLGAYESEYTPAVPITPDADNILYVNISATGNGSGNSWANAIPQLADALKYARLQYNADNTVYDAQPLKIFVAKGTYKPMYTAHDNFFTVPGSATSGSLTDQDNAFVMVKNVQIYGGFDPDNGIDDLTDTRIFGSNGSVLSGDIGQEITVLDNVYQIVISSNDVGNAVLNGFYITDARVQTGGSQFQTVNGYPVYRIDGTMACVRSSPTIENCIFYNNNRIAGNGGGIACLQQSSPAITNCSFTNNGGQKGGAIYNYQSSSPVITNCSFTSNSVANSDGNGGGAIYNANNCSPIITNCSFKNNGSTNGGGAIYNIASSPIITNSLFANNRARNITVDKNGGAIYNETTSSPVLTNVTIADNLGVNTIYSTGSGSTTFNNSIVFGTVSATYTAQNSLIEGNADLTNGNLDASGVTVDTVFTNASGGDYTLKSTSPVIDMGNNALNSTTFDLAGNVRLFGANIDMGAYELQSNPSNCSASTTWNGTSWSNGEPDYDTQAIIDGDLVISYELDACEVVVTPNGSLRILAEAVLYADWSVTNLATADNLVIENNGALIQWEDIENTGAITVQRETSPMFRLDYTLWSSPVSGMLLKDFSDVSPSGGNGTLWNRVYELGAAAWEQVWATQADYLADNSNTFTKAKGYLYRAKNDWITRDSGNPAEEDLGIFTGVPNNGNVTIATPLDFNAVGNPYPSPVEAEDFLAQNPGILYFWTNVNASNGTAYTNNNWAYYVAGFGGTGVADMADGGTIIFKPEDDMLIQPGQGFVIGTEESTVTFNNSMRATANGDFFKQMSNERHRFWLNLSNEEVVFNQILVGYLENATQGVDNGIDAKMFSYEGNAIYSLIENNEEKFVIQGRELPFTDSDIVPVGFRAVNAGSFSISLNNFNGIFEENVVIYLKDNYTQAQHNLNSGAYTFVSEEGVFDNRFEVIYQTTMSVENPELSHFDWIVYKQDKGFQIQTNGFDMKEVSVYDLLGRRIYTSEAEGTTHQIPAFGADGVFIVKVTTTEDKVLNKKVR